MAKIYGLFGAMTGKLADTVMSVRNGEQIARKYQPVVFNPSTPAQIAQRAKLKLMSQLSAVMGSVIAIPRVGSVSSRNLFTKKNIGKATYTSNTASINLESLDLTGSIVFLPTITGSRGTQITFALTDSAQDVDKLAYCFFAKQDDELRFISSAVVSEAGVDNVFPVSYPGNKSTMQGEVLALAYGIRLNSDAARAVYGNIEAPTAEDIARLVTSKTLRESDITLTETRGYTLAPAQQSNMRKNRASE